MKEILQAFWTIMKRKEMSYLPGQVAFFLVLSLIPLVTIITFFGTKLLPDLNHMIEFMNNHMPSDVSELLLPIVYSPSFHLGFGVFIFSTFLIAANGFDSMIFAADDLYFGGKETTWLYRRIKALFMLIIIVILILFILLVPVLGNQILSLLKEINLLGFIDAPVRFIYNFLRWPVTIFMIFFTINLIYVMIPTKVIKSRDVLPGAIFTTMGWLIVSGIFTFVIENWTAYNVLYGSLANIIVLMLWIYLLSYTFVMGLIINANSSKRSDKLSVNRQS